MKYDKEYILGLGRQLTREDFVFFWKHTTDSNELTKACFSQWWPIEFEVNGCLYNCAEQYMMAEKARLFNDMVSCKEIMSTNDPSEIKRLGRDVQGYDDALWNAHRFEAVVRGNVAKFSQDEELTNFLLSTGDKIIVEASPLDTIWGIGLDENSADAINPLLWRGTNLLGFALMEARDIIREQKRK